MLARNITIKDHYQIPKTYVFRLRFFASFFTVYKSDRESLPVLASDKRESCFPLCSEVSELLDTSFLVAFFES